jgi:hypothetical protein
MTAGWLHGQRRETRLRRRAPTLGFPASDLLRGIGYCCPAWTAVDRIGSKASISKVLFQDLP